MKLITPEKVFISLTFLIIYGLLTNGISITGNIINEVPSQMNNIKMANYYYLDLTSSFNINLNRLKDGDKIILSNAENVYDISILRIMDDTKIIHKKVDILVSPGQKRISLQPEDIKSIDFNNDGKIDSYIELIYVQDGLAKIIISK